MIVAVSACPRDFDTSYTEDTLASVVAAGAKCPIVIFDDLNWIGSAKACHELLKDCYAEYPDEEVLLLEDDVVACRNALPAVERVPFPRDCDMLSFFQCRVRYTPKAPRGVDFEKVDVIEGYKYRHSPIIAGVHLRRASRDFMYAQALKLSPKLVAHIANSPWPSDNQLELSPEELHFMAPFSIRDRALGYYAGQLSPWIGQVAPCWFEHVGEISAATSALYRDPKWRNKHGFRRPVAGNWLGIEHDALLDDVTQVHA